MAAPEAAACGADAGNIVDAELVCFDAGPSPLMVVVVYDQTGGVVSGPLFYDPLTGAPAVPGGVPAPCAGVVIPSPLDVEVVGPLGPGACGTGIRVTPCGPVEVTGPVTVVPDTGQVVSTYRNNVTGAGSWAVGVNTLGGKVKAVSFRRRAGGAAGTVTITDSVGVVTTLQAGESESWSVTALDDELVGPLLVTTTAVANDVIINWTEAP